jgi:hypothetical protein
VGGGSEIESDVSKSDLVPETASKKKKDKKIVAPPTPPPKTKSVIPKLEPEKQAHNN